LFGHGLGWRNRCCFKGVEFCLLFSFLFFPQPHGDISGAVVMSFHLPSLKSGEETYEIHFVALLLPLFSTILHTKAIARVIAYERNISTIMT